MKLSGRGWGACCLALVLVGCGAVVIPPEVDPVEEDSTQLAAGGSKETCGNGICRKGESCAICPSDCGQCPTCGDGVCTGKETCSNCPGDCGECPVVCGDRRCSLPDESCSSCPHDCGRCAECEPTAEICDNLDNDCDGQIDDGIVCCTPTAELCNQLDDDCDGQVDEGAVCCTATAELCNQLDDDCDGQIDEGNPAGVPCSTGQPGACAAGTSSCASGSFTCVPTNASTAEVCDNVDNDCDGQVDEGGACPVCGDGLCAGGETCGSCPQDCGSGSAEVCDGEDNDCDGFIDEETSGLPCDSGYPGICAAGSTVCDAGVTTCDPVTPAQPEICNGVDDDCDGATDEDLTTTCSTGLPGACAVGTATCTAGQFSVCFAPAPSAETCNGIDDDCDGVVDNNVPGAGQPCDGADADQCREGAVACIGGAMVCTDNTSNNFEICDHIDNDCDGQNNEGNICCGNGLCDSGEVCSTCAADCGPCP